MKTIYLHLGTYKTATTYLQEVFSKNFRTDKGPFFYPNTGRYHNAHHYLATPEFPAWQNGVSFQDYERTWREFQGEILGCQAESVIISSEMFCSVKDEHLCLIREMLANYNVKAVIYLRPQEEYIASLASQLIKGCNGNPHAYSSVERSLEYSASTRMLDYVSMCKRWEEAVGKGNLFVRPFERCQFYGGDICADFFHHLLGMNLLANLKLPSGNPNPRLCRDALEFKVIINQLPIERNDKNAILPALLKYSETSGSRESTFPEAHDILSPEQKLQIQQRFSQDNEYIARTFLGKDDGALFDQSKMIDSAEWIPYPGLDDSAIHSIADFIQKDNPEALAPIKRALEKCLKNGMSHLNGLARVMSK